MKSNIWHSKVIRALIQQKNWSKSITYTYRMNIVWKSVKKYTDRKFSIYNSNFEEKVARPYSLRRTTRAKKQIWHRRHSKVIRGNMAREKEHRATVCKAYEFKASLAGFTHADISAIRLCECKKLLGMLANARHSCINAAKIKKASVKIKAE